MTYLAEHAVHTPRPPRAQPRERAGASVTRPLCRDARWPAVASELTALRADRRCSVRIVDAACGSGTLLLCAVRLARELGFTAIEARGIDDAPTLIVRASATAATLHDPAVAITFETGDPVEALGVEADFPADIVLWHDAGVASRDPRLRQAVACAGRTLIADGPIPIGAAR